METVQINRRKNRSSDVQVALSFQLAATARRAKFTSIVLADELGLVIASVGHRESCENMAAIAPLVATRTKTFHGNVRFQSNAVRLAVAPLNLDGALLYLCAAEGEEDDITRELFSGGLGVSRILA
jgi:hypothetical protein